MTDLWPFRPLLGCSERLAFRGEVMQTRTTEQRLDLRGRPRQTFRYQHYLQSLQYAKAKALTRINGGQNIYVPVWPEMQVIAGAVLSGDTALTFDTTKGDWRVGGNLVVWAADNDYAVAEIASVSPTGVTLDGEIGNAFTSPIVMPVRLAMMLEGADISRGKTTQELTTFFQVRDNIDLSALYVSPYPTYLSYEVVTDKPVVFDAVAEVIGRASAYIDSDLGLVTQETLHNYASWGQTLVFHDERPNVWNRRLWLHALRGRQGLFWMPSFNQDIQPLVGTTIGAADVSFDIYNIAETGFYIGKHIMFELIDGTRYFREIVDADAGGAPVATDSWDGSWGTSWGESWFGAEAEVPASQIANITIDSALGAEVADTDLHMISFLALSRCAEDETTINHTYELCSVTSVPTIEVPDEIPAS